MNLINLVLNNPTEDLKKKIPKGRVLKALQSQSRQHPQIHRHHLLQATKGKKENPTKHYLHRKKYSLLIFHQGNYFSSLKKISQVLLISIMRDQK